MDPKYRAIYTNSSFRSKLMFGIETWGGSPKTLISQIQKYQDQATKLALPPNISCKSERQREKYLKWLPVNQEVIRATHSLTHRILNSGLPQEMTQLMPKNNNGLRISTQNKLGTRPKWLSQTKKTRNMYRSRAYLYNTLPQKITTLKEKFKFKKEIKKYLMEKKKHLKREKKT